MSYRAISKNERGISEGRAAFQRYDGTYKTYRIGDFSGGLSSPHIASLRNLRPDGKRLVGVPAPSALTTAKNVGTLSDTTVADGAVLGECEANGTWLFRKGTSLYARRGGVLYAVSENLFTSAASTIYSVGGSFLVTDGFTVYLVDGALSVSTLAPYIPLCYTSISADGTTVTEGEARNLLTPFIELNFAAHYGDSIVLPTGIAYDFTGFRIFRETDSGVGAEITASHYTRADHTITFDTMYNCGFRVRVRLAATGGEEELSLATDKMLRELFTLSGHVCPLALADGRTLFFPYGKDGGNEASCRILAFPAATAADFAYLSESHLVSLPHDEAVNAYAGYSEGLLVFSDRTIRKLAASLSAPNSDGVRTISLAADDFKSDFGCNMPGSIGAMNNTLFFADSRCGIFCIDRFGIAERDSSKRLSALVEPDFFAHTAAEYAAASAICAFGRYYLSVGGTTYILDLSDGIPSDGDNARWIEADAVSASRFLRYASDGIFYTARTGNALMRFLPRDAAGTGVTYRLKTAGSTLDESGEKTSLSFSLRATGGETTVRFFFDGVRAPDEYVAVFSGAMQTVSWKLPPRRFTTCAAEITSTVPLCLEALGFTVRI